MQPRLAVLVAGCAALIASMFPVIPAQAEDDAPDPYASHCVTEAHPLGTPSGTPVHEECFKSFAEAIYAATGGTLQVSSDFQPGELTQEMLDDAAAKNEAVGMASEEQEVVAQVISIEYWNRDFNANLNHSSTYTGGSTGCSGGHNWQLGYVGNFNNDKYSSARNFGGCDIVRHFEHQNFNGARKDCSPCAYIGDAMNNRTSSLKWKP